MLPAGTRQEPGDLPWPVEGVKPWERLVSQGIPENSHAPIGVDIDATTEEIKAGCRAQLKKCHPDRLGPNATPAEVEHIKKGTEAKAIMNAQLFKNPEGTGRYRRLNRNGRTEYKQPGLSIAQYSFPSGCRDATFLERKTVGEKQKMLR